MHSSETQNPPKQESSFSPHILEMFPENIIRYDRENRIRYLNAHLVHQLGLGNAEEVLGKRPSEAWPDGRYTAIEKACSCVLASNESQIIEIPVPINGGRTEQHQLSIVPEQDDSGEIIGTLLFGYDISDIRETEQRLRHFVDNLPGMAYTFHSFPDGHACFPYVSNAIRTIYGLTPEDVKDDFMPLHDLAHPEDRPAIEAALAKSMQTMDMFHVEFRICPPNLPERWLDARSVQMPQSDGSTLWYGMMLDITERKRTEEALRAREREFHNLAENTPDNITRWSTDGRILYCNPTNQRTLNKLADELIGKRIEEAFPDGRYTMITEAIARIVATGETEEFVNALELRVDGEARIHDIKLVPEFDENGKIVSVLGLGRDMTENHRIQDALKQREQEFRNLAESSPDSIIRYDHEGRIRYLNSKLESDLGYTTAELDGKLTREAWPDGRFSEIEQAVQHAITSAEQKTVILRAAINTTDSHFHQIRIIPEQDAAGQIIGALAFGSDVTEIFRLQESLEVREREFRTLAEHTPDMIVRYDLECRRIYVNPALSAAYGLSADQLLGTTPSQNPGCGPWLDYEQKLRATIANKMATDYELIWNNPKGKVFHTLFSITPEFGSDGELSSLLAVGRDITELAEQRERIHSLAFFDLVTKLPNRALFTDRLNQAIADARWHGTLLGIMLIDLDRFKTVNDTLGHNVGDALLREAAVRLTQSVRDYDTVARLGGDEFTVLLPEVRDAHSLSTIAEKILLAFAEPFLLEKEELFIGASIGIALYPNDSECTEGLLRSTDLAMYSAKNAGGHCFRYYRAELTSQAQGRMKIEAELRHALERNELELYFQPKVAMLDRHMIGSEALLRWNSSQFGLVPPDRFIGIAEDTGMIVKIGAWVLHEACRTARAWNADGRPSHKIAVNLSPRQFADVSLVQTIEAALHETDCRPEWIELEITESLLLGNSNKVRQQLEAMSNMGFSIAMDDFGTGYSALSYLSNFPINVLKIDRSFVMDIMTAPKKAGLIKAIIAMVDSLKMDMVAEGVETEEQAAFLLENGCLIAQGYLYGKPMPKHLLFPGT